MKGYTITTDVELADIQETIGVLKEKLEHYENNYPYAFYEIRKMKIAMEVLDDIENDVANMD